ncbi:hypothetical protein NERG_02199 [Nematocida ausubeli]|uniref:Uncharacterized protein n=1 Tax=Nematocida ausubeli (strain ATCC PRA-371 / ERTm2) TaxID=1913371 RepID=H8ZF30_NEMA1|nr:hypothetical protein NERG_02199 [Nematocida ausubeli]
MDRTYYTVYSRPQIPEQPELIPRHVHHDISYAPVFSHLKSSKFIIQFIMKCVILFFITFLIKVPIHLSSSYAYLSFVPEISKYLAILSFFGLFSAGTFLKHFKSISSPNNSIREYILAINLILLMISPNTKTITPSTVTYDAFWILFLSFMWAFKLTFYCSDITNYLIRRTQLMALCSVSFVQILLLFSTLRKEGMDPAIFLNISLLFSGYTISSIIIEYFRFSTTERLIVNDIVKILSIFCIFMYLLYAQICYQNAFILYAERWFICTPLVFFNILLLLHVFIKSCYGDIIYYKCVSYAKNINILYIILLIYVMYVYSRAITAGFANDRLIKA